MGFKGIGDMVKFVEEWNFVFEMLENIEVIQTQTMSGICSMTYKPGTLELQMGDR